MFYSTSRLARIADISESTVRRLVQRGVLNPSLLGGRFVFDEDDRNRLLAHLRDAQADTSVATAEGDGLGTL